MKVTCWFGNRGRPEERYSKTFDVYKVDEEVPVDYIPYSEIRDRIDEIANDVYLETVDGWVAPVLWSYGRGLTRIASDKYATFHKFRVRDGEQPIYFRPPKNWHLTQRGKNKFLTKKQKLFCWEYARIGDPIEAAKRVGFVDYVHVKRVLLRNENIKKKTVDCFRRQLEWAGLKETELVAGRLPKLNDLFDRMIAAIVKRVEDGEASDKDVEVLKSVMKQNGELLNFSADLLGYKGDTEETSLKIEAKKTSVFKHKLPEPAVEEADFEEIKEKEAA